MQENIILSGDIGGTKTVLALHRVGALQPELITESIFPSGNSARFEDLLVHFLEDSGQPDVGAVCLGVAGPVVHGRCDLTNLPWVLEERALAEAAGAAHACLLNDLEAAAYGMLHLDPADRHVLNSGAPSASGTMGVVAAGTGLGEAYLHWVNGAHHPMATEGGHTEFGPRNELEDELLAFLRRDTGGHVSYERILSGPGVWNLYRFLRQRGDIPESAAVAEAMLDSDPAAVIGAHAMEQGDPLCVRTLELFAEIYGAEAGNLALKGLTTGGLFVGGGIAPKIRPFIEGGAFMRGFLDKGRFRDTLAAMPVVLSLNARAPLLGAAYYGARLCGGG